MKKVEHFSVGYFIARFWVKISYKYVYYRNVLVRGRNKFKPNDPIIFAPNHQNALMDALVFVTTLRQQPIFLARADIFNSKMITRFLNFIKMMPVYRIRDGYENLGKNTEVFDRCTEILKTGHSLCLFPEGNHNDKRFFRPLKKGLARIAFEAEDQCDFKLGLKIIPTGIDYSSYSNVRGRLTVSYGEPITITDLKDLYRSEPQHAMRELNRRIAVNIEPHMIEIPWEDIYETVMRLRIIYGARFRKRNKMKGLTLFHKFDGDKAMIRKIGALRESNPDAVAGLNSLVTDYWRLIRTMKLRDHTVGSAPYSFMKLFFNTLLLAVGFPLHLYSLINNYHLFRIPDLLAKKLFKDPQFRATGAYVISLMVMMPLFYGIQTLIVALIFKTWWIWVGYLALLLPTGIYMLHYMFEVRKWFARLRYTSMLLRKHPEAVKVLKMRREIVERMDGLI
jgi:1-acyl-sn-glycerol-3-phosphate acyltransferase